MNTILETLNVGDSHVAFRLHESDRRRQQGIIKCLLSFVIETEVTPVETEQTLAAVVTTFPASSDPDSEPL